MIVFACLSACMLLEFLPSFNIVEDFCLKQTKTLLQMSCHVAPPTGGEEADRLVVYCSEPLGRAQGSN